VEITFEDGLLTIQGERLAARDARGERAHRSERYYGAFRRSITLPSHVQADKIEATAQDGVLQVMVPKAPEARAKRSRRQLTAPARHRCRGPQGSLHYKRLHGAPGTARAGSRDHVTEPFQTPAADPEMRPEADTCADALR
jgi:Hsp20/alpha crystallin family